MLKIKNGIFFSEIVFLFIANALCQTLPSTNDIRSQFLFPISQHQSSFLVNGQIKSPLIYNNGNPEQTPFIAENGNIKAFIGPLSESIVFNDLEQYGGSLDLVWILDAKGIENPIYVTKLLLSYNAWWIAGTLQDKPIISVEVIKEKFGDISQTHSETFQLLGGKHIVDGFSDGKYSPDIQQINGPPTAGYLRISGPHVTIPIALDQNYFGWNLKQIKISFCSQTFRGYSFPPPLVEIEGVNIQTYIDVNSPTFFYQLNPSWANDLMGGNNSKYDIIKINGCVITSYCMAMRGLGIIKGPDNQDITPKTLNSWLRSHNGYSENTNSVLHSKVVQFTTDAKNLGYNNGLSIKVSDADIKVTENALANKYVALVRVARAPTTKSCGPAKHTVLTYGLVPDFENNKTGTYKINDPGKSAGITTLWRRDVCEPEDGTDYQGLFSNSKIVQVTNGTNIIQSPLTIALHSPGKLLVTSPEGYQIGYVSGTSNFVNTFQDAKYEFLDPNESFDPVEDSEPDPAPKEKIQIVTIYDRPGGQAYDIKVVGTGTGPFTLNMHEEIWKDNTLVPVLSKSITGSLIPGLVVSAVVPPNNGPADNIAPTAPGQPSFNNIGCTTINVAWTQATDNVGVSNYKIEYKVGGSGVYTQLATVSSSVLSYSAVNLQPLTQYYFRITAIDAAGNSSTSQENNVTTLKDTTPPSAPGNPSLYAISTSQIDVSWNLATDNVRVTRYELFMKKSSDASFTKIANGNITSYSATGLQSSTIYIFQVAAFDAAGNTRMCANSTQISTKSAPPTFVGSQKATAKGDNSALITWSATDDVAVTSYTVFGWQDGAASTIIQSGSGGSNGAVYWNGLKPGIKYWFYIRIADGSGNTTVSTNQSFILACLRQFDSHM